jgi:hypothetical protein
MKPSAFVQHFTFYLEVHCFQATIPTLASSIQPAGAKISNACSLVDQAKNCFFLVIVT